MDLIIVAVLIAFFYGLGRYHGARAARRALRQTMGLDN